MALLAPGDELAVVRLVVRRWGPAARDVPAARHKSLVRRTSTVTTFARVGFERKSSAMMGRSGMCRVPVNSTSVMVGGRGRWSARRERVDPYFSASSPRSTKERSMVREAREEQPASAAAKSGVREWSWKETLRRGRHEVESGVDATQLMAIPDLVEAERQEGLTGCTEDCAEEVVRTATRVSEVAQVE